MFNGECKLAAVWLYSKDPDRAGEFYRNVLEMKQIEHGETNSFDGGGIRLSIHPAPESMKEIPNGESFLVFYVTDGIEEKYEKLVKKGVSFSGGVTDQPYGKIAEFQDPDGHSLFLWQPPPRDSKKFPHVSGLVEHYERVSARLYGA